LIHPTGQSAPSTERRVVDGNIQFAVTNCPTAECLIWTSTNLLNWTNTANVAVTNGVAVFEEEITEAARFYGASPNP
jgi:hypothetical protein